MTDEVVGHCREAGCPAAQDGACLENLTVQECPNFVVGEPEPESTAQTATEQAIGEDDAEPIPVRGAGTFSSLEVDVFLRETGGTVRTIALVGDPEVGKTTLISSLYELARVGKLSLGFAGSETLRGFEMRCHLSRTKSGRTDAATQRTRTMEGLSFLHLQLVEGEGQKAHLVMADRRGEDYEPLLTRPEEAANLTELRQSDVVALLVDGSRLLDPAQRQIQIARARRLWLAMDAANLVSPGRQYQLILTKCDDLIEDEAGKAARKLFEGLAAELKTRFSLIDIQSFEIAARPPKSGGKPFGLGLEPLVLSWLQSPVAKPFASALVHRDGPTVFDRLTLRLGEPGART